MTAPYFVFFISPEGISAERIVICYIKIVIDIEKKFNTKLILKIEVFYLLIILYSLSKYGLILVN